MNTAFLLGVVRILLALGVIILMQRRKFSLELSLLAASFVLALSCAIWPLEWGIIIVKSCMDSTLLALLCTMSSILLLSGLMDKTGQSHRLAEGMKAYISSARVRLLFFPALIGLLPVPGGAIFSCPMVSEVARDMSMTEARKGAINYWFRHIWECVWPLYPGFVLVSGLLNLSPLAIIGSNWPILVAGLAAGYVFYLRGIRVEPGVVDDAQPESVSRWAALKEGSSIITALSGAFLFRMLFPELPPGYPFAMGFCLGSTVCLVFNPLPVKTVLGILTGRRTVGILCVVMAIFAFKGVMAQSGVMQAIGLALNGSKIALFIACIVLPTVGGMFSGIMVGLVGITFPILIPLVDQAGAWDNRLAWLGMAMMFGYIGQMLSPVHVCLVVTCRFFEVRLGDIMRLVGVPCLVLAATAIGWFFLRV